MLARVLPSPKAILYFLHTTKNQKSAFVVQWLKAAHGGALVEVYFRKFRRSPVGSWRLYPVVRIVCELEVGQVDDTRIGSGFFVADPTTRAGGQSQFVLTAGHVVGSGIRQPKRIRIWAFDDEEKSRAVHPSSVTIVRAGGDLALLQLPGSVDVVRPFRPFARRGFPRSPFAASLAGYSALSNSWFLRALQVEPRWPWLVFLSRGGEPGVSGGPVFCPGDRVAGVYSGKYYETPKNVELATAIDGNIVGALWREAKQREGAQ